MMIVCGDALRLAGIRTLLSSTSARHRRQMRKLRTSPALNLFQRPFGPWRQPKAARRIKTISKSPKTKNTGNELDDLAARMAE
jgi:hypothetical protein